MTDTNVIELTDAEISVLVDVTWTEIQNLRTSVTELVATGDKDNAHIAHHRAKKNQALMGIFSTLVEGRGDGLDDLPYNKLAVEGVPF